MLFHQGARQLGEGLRTGEGLAALRAIAAPLSPAGQLQVATALDLLAVLEGHLEVLRRRLLDAARHLAGARVLTARLYGVGPVTALALVCWLGIALVRRRGREGTRPRQRPRLPLLRVSERADRRTATASHPRKGRSQTPISSVHGAGRGAPISLPRTSASCSAASS